MDKCSFELLPTSIDLPLQRTKGTDAEISSTNPKPPTYNISSTEIDDVAQEAHNPKARNNSKKDENKSKGTEAAKGLLRTERTSWQASGLLTQAHMHQLQRLHSMCHLEYTLKYESV